MKTHLFLFACISMALASAQGYSQTWSSGKAIFHPVRGGNIASCSDQTDGYLFIVSGRDIDRVIKTTQRYTMSTNSWDTLAPHPTGLLGAATTILNNSLYIIGGVINPPGFGQDTVYKLDIAQNKWTKAAPFPYDLVDAKAIGYQDSLIYVAGGLGGTDSANVVVYNSITNMWRKGTTIPSATGLNFGGFTRAGDKLIYMCGTDGFGSGNYYTTVWVGTISQTNRSLITWKKGADFPGNTRSFFDAHPWMNNSIIMTGGSTDNTFATWSDECYVFHPEKNTWAQLPDKPTAWLTGQSGTVTLPGKNWALICAGGFDSDYIHATEILEQTETPSSVKDEVPNFFKALNSPNPFQDHTLIQYTMTGDQQVRITICDTLGRLIETLADEKKNAGTHSISYTGQLTPGIYYCKISSGSQSQIIKMVCVN